jgi:hypothetical protein
MSSLLGSETAKPESILKRLHDVPAQAKRSPPSQFGQDVRAKAGDRRARSDWTTAASCAPIHSPREDGKNGRIKMTAARERISDV